jgi:hypothetical protein
MIHCETKQPAGMANIRAAGVRTFLIAQPNANAAAQLIKPAEQVIKFCVCLSNRETECVYAVIFIATHKANFFRVRKSCVMV